MDCYELEYDFDIISKNYKFREHLLLFQEIWDEETLNRLKNKMDVNYLLKVFEFLDNLEVKEIIDQAEQIAFLNDLLEDKYKVENENDKLFKENEDLETANKKLEKENEDLRYKLMEVLKDLERFTRSTKELLEGHI